MKKILFMIFALSLVLNAEVITKTITKNSVGIGYANSYDEALNKALVNALEQMTGAKISSSTTFNKNLKTKNKEHLLQKEYEDLIYKKTSGQFDSYKVLSQNKTNDGYEVKVKISKNKSYKYYKAPGLDPNNRRKISIYPVFANQKYYEVDKIAYPYNKITSALTLEITNAITKTRKFSVLDRGNNLPYEIEKNFILENAKKDELLKLGQALGADYLFVANIRDFRVFSEDKQSIISKASKVQKVKALIDYKILLMSSRVVKFTSSLKIDESFEGDLNSLYKDIADNIAKDIINNIYPLKIVEVKNGQILLSQKLNLGDIYEVYKLGKRVIDPYTKEFVAREEKLVGKIEIIKVAPKLSYAKIIEGKASRGDICRIKSNSSNQSQRADVSEEEKPSDVKFIEGGGVKLPFD